jgi:aminopeptidase-like protein
MNLSEQRGSGRQQPAAATSWQKSDRSAGGWMHEFVAELFPICRSITGEGLRQTLRRIQREVPLIIHEVASGTPVLDWNVPNEWNIGDAWIKNSRGERVVDFRRSNLHVVNYSAPVRARLSLPELKPHLHSLPERPDWIPYRTSYYQKDWGFCLPHRQLQQLGEEEYDVCIESTLAPGSLSYGELLIQGESEDEFLMSCHCCHPSMANDNLSGVAVAVALARQLANAERPLWHSYRFLFIPGTIGAITWLARNEDQLARIKHGLVLTCVGDAGNITYKKSRRGDARIDRAVEHVLSESQAPHRVIEFFPYGYDERQFCSPGFNLPVGCFMRSQHGTFPEYHTSADNLEFIKPEFLADSLEKLMAVISLIEGKVGAGCVECENDEASDTHHASRITHHALRFLNLKPKGEPQLGKYGIYEALGGDVMTALWVLNFSDGTNSLEDIAARASLPFDKIVNAADILLSRGLLKEVRP